MFLDVSVYLRERGRTRACNVGAIYWRGGIFGSEEE